MIQRVRIRNFKALRDTGNLKLSDLSVFIGNNGSGKSSVLEALRFLQVAVEEGIQQAFTPHGSIENVRHYLAKLEKPKTNKWGFTEHAEPIEISITCKIQKSTYEYTVQINTTENGDFLVVEHELLKENKRLIFESRINGKFTNTISYYSSTDAPQEPYILIEPTGRLFLASRGRAYDDSQPFFNYIEKWQFLNLNAHEMGNPVVNDRTRFSVKLAPDGRNIAALLRQIAREPELLDAIVEKIRFVLPYASDFQTRSTTEFDQKIELQLYEEGQKVPIPGWLFSSGTLRILAILAVLNQQDSLLPSVLFIEEVENGLDPRTVGMLMEEIRRTVYYDKIQVVTTTHSPYFLDLLELRHLIVTERIGDAVVFSRPDTDKQLGDWKVKFSPGRLYTMNRLTR